MRWCAEWHHPHRHFLARALRVHRPHLEAVVPAVDQAPHHDIRVQSVVEPDPAVVAPELPVLVALDGGAAVAGGDVLDALGGFPRQRHHGIAHHRRQVAGLQRGPDGCRVRGFGGAVAVGVHATYVEAVFPTVLQGLHRYAGFQGVANPASGAADPVFVSQDWEVAGPVPAQRCAPLEFDRPVAGTRRQVVGLARLPYGGCEDGRRIALPIIAPAVHRPYLESVRRVVAQIRHRVASLSAVPYPVPVIGMGVGRQRVELELVVRDVGVACDRRCVPGQCHGLVVAARIQISRRVRVVALYRGGQGDQGDEVDRHQPGGLAPRRATAACGPAESRGRMGKAGRSGHGSRPRHAVASLDIFSHACILPAPSRPHFAGHRRIRASAVPSQLRTILDIQDIIASENSEAQFVPARPCTQHRIRERSGEAQRSVEARWWLRCVVRVAVVRDLGPVWAGTRAAMRHAANPVRVRTPSVPMSAPTLPSSPGPFQRDAPAAGTRHCRPGTQNLVACPATHGDHKEIQITMRIAEKCNQDREDRSLASEQPAAIPSPARRAPSPSRGGKRIRIPRRCRPPPPGGRIRTGFARSMPPGWRTSERRRWR